MYLLTSPHASNVPGLIVVRRETVAADLGWSPTDLDRVWSELGGADPMAVEDWEAGLVWMPRRCVTTHRPAQSRAELGAKLERVARVPASQARGQVHF